MSPHQRRAHALDPGGLALLQGSLAGRIFDDLVVTVADGVIQGLRPATDADADSAGILLPGLVDIHNHGGGGASFHSTSADEIAVAASIPAAAVDGDLRFARAWLNRALA